MTSSDQNIADRPLVSVLLPFFNAQRFLGPAIESILRQTVSDIEILCIDDGSTDESAPIVLQYALTDQRIRLFSNPHNIGLAASLNRVLPFSTGEFVARMDADDISLPNRFEKQINLLRFCPTLVAVGGHAFIIDDKDNVIATKYFPVDSSDCYQVLLNYMPVQPPVLMVRGEVFRRCRYDEKKSPQDDISILFPLLQHGSISNVDDIIFCYRHTRRSLTNRNPKDVYFMALRVRVDGIINFHYRPNMLRLVLLALQTIFVLLLPSSVLLTLFKRYRYDEVPPAIRRI